MLTNHIAQVERKRTSKRSTTKEGIALKELRLSYGFSMRQLGALIGKSDSYISHLENGRLDFPQGQSLELILAAFGGMKPKSFFEKVRVCRLRAYQEDFVSKWLRNAQDQEVEAIYALLSQGP